jgi:hemoglobin
MAIVFASCIALLISGCVASGKKKDKDSFTSGSPDADRRAENIVPDQDSEKTDSKSKKDGTPASAQQTLYQRLGEKAGIQRIVDDFIQRVLEDPRVNWTRSGVAKKSWFRSQRAAQWQATPESINRLKLHFVQFISLAAGGPSDYQGKPIGPAHLEMQITKAEFDATIGDLKATLDKLQIAPDVQKDLVAIFESARQQIVTVR